MWTFIAVLLVVGDTAVAADRPELHFGYVLGRGANLINIPMYKTSTGGAFKASDIIAQFGATAVARMNPFGMWIPYTNDVSFGSPNFEIDPSQAYAVLMPRAIGKSLFGFGVVPGGAIEFNPPRKLPRYFNPWGFPAGVPYMMSYRDLLEFPSKRASSGGLVGMVLITTQVINTANGPVAKYITYFSGSQNQRVTWGQGFLVWLWANQVFDGSLKLPMEGDNSYAYAATTIGRSVATGGNTTADTPAKETPMAGSGGIRALSATDPELVMYADTFNHCIRKSYRSTPTTVKVKVIAGIPKASGFVPEQSGTAATGAQLNLPTDVEYDIATDTFYIADSLNRIIRKVKNNLIYTIAGRGTEISGSRGDGGSPREATFLEPTSVVLDGSRLYVLDRAHARVRSFPVSGDSKITLFAGSGSAASTEEGTLATNASFGNPVALAKGLNSGVFFVADKVRGNVRKIQSGIATTVIGSINQANPSPGNTTPRVAATGQPMKTPVSICEAVGGLFVGDDTQRKLFRIGYADTRVSLVAGDGSIGGTVEPTSGSVLATSSSVVANSLHSADNVVVHLSDGFAKRIRRLVIRP